MIAIRRNSLALLLIAAFASPDRGAFAQQSGILKDVGFDQHLSEQIPLDIPVRDESGKTVRLGSYFGKRPVILSMVYYECPLLCNQELNGLTRALRALNMEPGKDFEVVTVSFNPLETPELAAKKKARYMKSYDHAGGESAWHFLVGDEQATRMLAQSIGFRYQYNPKNKQAPYAHAAGIVVATPEGKIAHYFFGISYSARDLKLALTEAGNGKIGSPVEQIMLFCYDFDPLTGKYTLAVTRLLQVLGTAMVAILATFIGVMLFRDHRRGAVAPAPSPEN
jgi:protein SCO1/2